MDNKEDYGTITEFFFITCDLAFIGIIQTLHTFEENLKIMERLQKTLKSLNKQHFQCRNLKFCV